MMPFCIGYTAMKLVMPREGSVAYSQKEEIVRRSGPSAAGMRAQNEAFREMLQALVRAQPNALWKILLIL